MIPAINQTNFQQEVIEAQRPVLVHFCTPWCGLCQLIEPILSQLSQEKSNSIKLVSINADENFKLTNHYRIRNLPTIILFCNGQPVQKMDNFHNRDQLQKALISLMQDTFLI